MGSCSSGGKHTVNSNGGMTFSADKNSIKISGAMNVTIDFTNANQSPNNIKQIYDIMTDDSIKPYAQHFVIGETYSRKDEIKAAGGRWDSNLRKWYFRNPTSDFETETYYYPKTGKEGVRALYLISQSNGAKSYVKNELENRLRSQRRLRDTGRKSIFDDTPAQRKRKMDNVATRTFINYIGSKIRPWDDYNKGVQHWDGVNTADSLSKRVSIDSVGLYKLY